MAASEDLINFDVIEGQKENIQALPSGRSARKLAELFSPSPLQQIPTPTEQKTIHDRIRSEYENEISNLAEADDPLDVFDRYVQWTLDAYPSAQATPQSQLHTLLERATRTFVNSPQYKNDPRYLRMWLRYIQFFSDSPRETFMYLSRHAIAETLALYYEEYAAWLEGAGRWNQAEEVYKMGIEREARPVQRLLRKFKEFEERRAQTPGAEDAPSSPALPTVRPALAAKVDPFVGSSRPLDPQAPRSNNGLGTSAKPGRAKLAVFSDADSAPSALSSRGAGSKGWESIGSLGERKKENAVEPKPWAGETLKAGGKKRTGPKMEVFKDKSLLSQISHFVVSSSEYQVTINPNTGKKERIFVDLATLYPTPSEAGTELSFEEVWAMNQGWLDRSWDEEPVVDENGPFDENSPHVVDAISRDVEKLVIHRDAENAGSSGKGKMMIHRDTENESRRSKEKMMIHRDAEGENRPVKEKLVIHRDTEMYDENGAVKEKPRGANKSKKSRMMEVNETQIIKAKLDSPSRPRLKKRSAAEPTMTMTIHTKSATDDIYDIFNQPLAKREESEAGDSEDDYDTDGDYTSGAESTCTTRQIGDEFTEAGYMTGEVTEEVTGDITGDVTGDVTSAADETSVADETSDVKSVSEWSDFSTRRHIPNIDDDATGEQDNEEEEERSDLIDTSDPDPSGPVSEKTGETEDERTEEGEEEEDAVLEDGIATPVEESSPPHTRTTFIPIPPEDYEPRTRPYRDPAEVANNRLPFMTPITERTEVSLHIPSARVEHCKTPSRRNDGSFGMDSSSEASEFSSPLIDLDEVPTPSRTPPASLQQQMAAASTKAKTEKPLPPKGPIIKDTQCNPVDDSIRLEILANIQPPLASYTGFYDHKDEKYEKGSEIRRFAKAMTKANKSSGDKTSTISGPVIRLPDISADYTVKKELGAGAFAPVYLVENSAPEEEEDDEGPVAMGKGTFAVSHREALEAVKMEMPPSAWEFYMMRLAHARLGVHDRAVSSLTYAHEMHLFQDEGFLILPYHANGSLLDVVNFFRTEPSGVMDEQLAMFFTVELFRTVEALHGKSILHGDLKPDNCLLRLDVTSSTPALSSEYRPDGTEGWAARGITLIDFGRGIDMRAFPPDVSFIADWKTTAQDCAEMREGRPWTWQIDYHGLAGIIHCLLFGRYIETVRADAGGLGTARKYKVRESLKRYWQVDLWNQCFDLLLNPASHAGVEDGGKMPLLKGMKRVRTDMEKWLVATCERGAGLKALVAKVEAYAKARKEARRT
ncbi:hypothetical protein jhhlp_007333 [Lomentospora prolificans]|uniref:Protein kinase domain-containing protein n=1 Tax=Lomentospora prolificans TaxID=41688 RepID=A0A2N3N2C2_9PEZI|nr:hypothetical protein jhhlp_007333 [Lomentospora prolificans]